MELNYASPFGAANSRNIPAAPQPEHVPVAPLPPIVGEPEPPYNPPVAPPPGGGMPVIPLPPIVGAPAPPSVDNTPVFPLPPIVGEPAPPSTDNIPVFPLPPIVGEPQPPQPPAYPGPCSGPFCPGPVYPNSRFATLRFLHAVMDGEPVRITIGPRTAAASLAYGNMTGYYNVPEGFRTITISSARQPRMLLFQGSVPLSADEILTLAIVRSGGGLDLVRVSDLPCNSRPRDRACIRAVNLVYDSPALDMVLADGRVVFTDVRYKEVTTWRQARPRTYDLYIAQTPYVLSLAEMDIQTVEDMPVVIPDYYLPGYGAVQPLVSFYVDARAGAMETVYILGNWNFGRAVRTKVVENY